VFLARETPAFVRLFAGDLSVRFYWNAKSASGQSRLLRDVGRSAASPQAADQFSRTDLPNNDRRHSMPATRRLVVGQRTTAQKRGAEMGDDLNLKGYFDDDDDPA
jgi:hypothetical protein